VSLFELLLASTGDQLQSDNKLRFIIERLLS